jgi:shikimate dehydrogenase
VIDIVAWPPETTLVQRARAAGALAIGGVPMLVGQAARSFELWTGEPAPLETMAAEAARACAAAGHPIAMEVLPCRYAS